MWLVCVGRRTSCDSCAFRNSNNFHTVHMPIPKFIKNFEFRNYRLCLEWPLECFAIFRGEMRRSLYCSSSNHQKSVSAHDKSKHNKPSPSSPESASCDSGSVHESQRQQLWLSLHRSHCHTCCVRFCFECFTISRGDKRRNRYVSPPQDSREGCHLN